MLQPDGEPQQPIAETGLETGFCTHIDMGHRRGMRHKTFHAAERFGHCEALTSRTKSGGAIQRKAVSLATPCAAATVSG